MTSQQAEAALIDAYRRQAESYAGAGPVLEELTAGLREGRDVEEALARLARLFQGVAAVDAEVAAAKQVWQQEGGKPGPELEGLLARNRALVEQLLERVRTAEGEAAARRDALLPQLDGLARAHHMQRAYQATLTARPPGAG
jgi:hypothetical protein